MRAEAALAALPAMAASGLPVVVCSNAGWQHSSLALPVLATPFFGEIHGGVSETPTDNALFQELAGLDEGAARKVIEAVVTDEVARILRLPADAVDRRRPLTDLGMDSLMVVELRLAVARRLRMDLPFTVLADGTSAAGLARRLAEAVAGSRPLPELDVLAAQHGAVSDPFALGGVTPRTPA